MIEALLRRGTLLTVGVLIICLLGILAATRVPVQMIPDLDVRVITVRTQWPGATPQDIEKEIVIEQEEYLRNVPNLQRMVSQASTGAAEIELEFPFGTDIDDALLRVNNALTQVPDYPENVDEPRLYATSFSQNSFMYFRVAPLPGNPAQLDMDMMRDFVDDNVRTRMERVEGVSEVRIGGAAERQIQIRVDAQRLATRGISLADVRRAVRERNRDISGGDIDSGKRRYLLRTVGRFADAAAIENLVLARRGDAVTRLGDVATVSLGHAEIRSESFVNGAPVISLSVRRETGSNVIAIQDAMLAEVPRINSDVLEPVGLQLELNSSDVRYVQASVTNVWRNLAIGAVLATGVMYLFLGSLATTSVGVVGIPVCTIASFIGLLVFGRTINVISLAGVAFAIGMTLDNAIVVLENIERERRRGLERMAAAVAGVRQVWPAVLASTMTTLLVFTPIVFIQEEAGQLYSDIAIAIGAAILASLAVAVTVVPSASSHLAMAGVDGAGFQPAWQRRILAGVDWLLARRVRRWGCISATLALTATIIVTLTPPAEYLPEGEEAKIFSSMLPPPGTNLDEMVAIGEQLHAYFLPQLKVAPEAFVSGATAVPPLAYFIMHVSPERIFVIAETEDPDHVDALIEAVDAKFESYPAMRAFSARGSIISSNDGGTRSVNLDIAGPDLAAIYAVATNAYDRAEAAFDGPQVRADPATLSLAQPLVRIEPRAARLAELGLSTEDVGFGIAALADGAYVDEFYLANDKIDIYLYGSEPAGSDVDGLRKLPMVTPDGAILPVASLASVTETVDTDVIRRLDGRRTVTLNVIPPRSVALETGVAVVRDEVVGAMRADDAIPDSVSVDISGASDQLDATRAALGGNYVVAVLLCYLLLVAIFTHWGYPLLILTTVPLGIAGGIAGLWLMNVVGATLPAVGLAALSQPFDMITMLGFLILVGTVVNNPILIVDQARYNRDRLNMDAAAAVREAVAARLRPILMTTITTSFGLAPLVFLPGAGTELYRGVGAIVLFGLLFTMVVTLTFLPALLLTVFGHIERRRHAANHLQAAD